VARISTHVLDVAKGKPAAGIPVDLYLGLTAITTARTNADGRTDKPLLTAETLQPGGYDLTFHVGDYFREQGIEAFFEKISIGFVVTDTQANYHVPLLLAPHGYSTYRGS
jgi:5-hydroxyisourate hydrolase